MFSHLVIAMESSKIEKTNIERPDWKAERCKSCDRPNMIGFTVSDDMWLKVTGGKESIHCLNCFDNMAHIKGISYLNEIEELYVGTHDAARVYVGKKKITYDAND